MHAFSVATYLGQVLELTERGLPAPRKVYVHRQTDRRMRLMYVMSVCLPFNFNGERSSEKEREREGVYGYMDGWKLV